MQPTNAVAAQVGINTQPAPAQQAEADSQIKTAQGNLGELMAKQPAAEGDTIRHLNRQPDDDEMKRPQ